MALLDLLKNPDAYDLSYGGPSKGITYLPNQSPFHLKRVEWKVNSDNHDPIFLIGEDHNNGQTTDYFFRGGKKAHDDRAKIDSHRIGLFLQSNVGSEFLLRQGALQFLNPQVNTRTFNAGISLRTQIAASGLARFKRHGVFPEPAGVNINSQAGAQLGNAIGESSIGQSLNNLGSKIGLDLGFTSKGIGQIATNAMGGDYISLIGNIKRENVFGVGDPGGDDTQSVLDKIVGDINPFKKKKSYGDYQYQINKWDKINYQTVYTSRDGQPDEYHTSLLDDWEDLRDFVDFRFEVLQSNDSTVVQNIIFRAFLDNFSDNYTATHNEIKYNGRGEPFYTYNSFNRAVSISFKIAAQSREEMKPLYQKLNYLVAQTAPNYSSTGRIRTPYMRLTMGDYFSRIPGFCRNISVAWNTNYPWEIKLDREGKDNTMKVLPHVLDVTLAYQPIHSFVPNNGLNAPFIGIGPDAKGQNNWLLSHRPVEKELVLPKREPIVPPPTSVELGTDGMRVDLSKYLSKKGSHSVGSVGVEHLIMNDEQPGLIPGLDWMGGNYNTGTDVFDNLGSADPATGNGWNGY